MKYLIFIGLTLLFLQSCGDSKEKQEIDIKNTKTNDIIKDDNSLKISFYNQDSLQIHFTYFREQDSIITKKQLAYQNELQRKTKDLQNYILKYEEKAKANLLSQNEALQMQQIAQNKEQAIIQYQQNKGAKLEQEAYNKMEIIGNKIEFFAAKYAQEHNIDLLLSHGRGGQFKFINSSMDVTKDFIDYLNKNQDNLIGDIEN